MNTPDEYTDIAPYGDREFQQKISQLVKEPLFEHAVKYVMPDTDFDEMKSRLVSIPDGYTFQHQIMKPFLQMLIDRTTSGVTVSGLEHIKDGCNYTFMSNHRDIVLDASFLNYCFLTNNLPTSEVAIGDNLLIYDWITDLVKLNKSFIVKRNLRITQALQAARQLSGYIHYAINTKHESVWIAQREGRAKDSNDITQESLIKMLGLEGGEKNMISNIAAAHIMPTSISYEFDPNDYLKAREFLLKRLDGNHKKSQHDDLLSMETGLLQPKGRIHFEITGCINEEIEQCTRDLDKIEAVKAICRLIDRRIHLGYRIYPINYVAYDLLHNTNRFASRYTSDDLNSTKEYLNAQLNKVQLPDISQLDHNYMWQMMLTMYANPLCNKLAAKGEDL